MTTKWIDEQEYGIGDKAFLINISHEFDGPDRYILRDQPAYTNTSQEPRLHGWCGTYNNVATYGEGAWKVIRIARSGRFLIQELEGQELEEFLDEMGYPELKP